MELDGSTEKKMPLDGNTFFIYNKKYEHAKLAQWGTERRNVGTYEQGIYPDQLWYLKESTNHPGYFYIENVFHGGYRLAKWGKGDRDVGVYNGPYFDDQLWKFEPKGDYYRIYSKHYPHAKITKWGKGNGDWGTFAGSDHDDQLWKLVPRFMAEARKEPLWSVDNR